MVKGRNWPLPMDRLVLGCACTCAVYDARPTEDEESEEQKYQLQRTHIHVAIHVRRVVFTSLSPLTSTNTIVLILFHLSPHG